MAAPHRDIVRIARSPRRGSVAGLAGLLLTALCLALLLLLDHTLFINVPAPTHSTSQTAVSCLEKRYEDNTQVEEWQRTYKGLTLDGDRLTEKILAEFYAETISGDGGMPGGFIKDLVLRSYFGRKFDLKMMPVLSRDYTGPNHQPGEADYKLALKNFQEEAKSGEHFLGSNDNLGWIWVGARQKADGLWLYMDRAPPYGERALAIMKADNIDEFFEKVDWHMLFVRLYKPNLWGGKAKKFPYPIKGRPDYR